MRWAARKPEPQISDYARRFAFLPTRIDDTVVWLEFYQTLSEIAQDRLRARSSRMLIEREDPGDRKGRPRVDRKGTPPNPPPRRPRPPEPKDTTDGRVPPRGSPDVERGARQRGFTTYGQGVPSAPAFNSRGEES